MLCTLPSTAPQNNVGVIQAYELQPTDPAFTFNPDIAKAIKDLWGDAVIPKLMERSSDFYLMDNAS